MQDSVSAGASPATIVATVHPTATIVPGAILAEGVTVHAGAYLGSTTRAQAGVVIGPNASIIDRKHPSNDSPVAPTVLSENAVIGANAVLLPGVTVGRNAVIGAGAVVTRSVPPHAIVTGNPARIIGYVDASSTASVATGGATAPPEQGVVATRVSGVTLHRFPLIKDLRGDLTVGEFLRDIPFVPKRYFMVFDVPSAKTRGEHAHRRCEQFLICVRGRCGVVADDGQRREEFILDAPNLGLYLPPMVWGVQYKYSSDAVLLVFASEYYDSSDYIRQYDEFLRVLQDAD